MSIQEADTKIEEAKGKFEEVLVVGIRPDGVMDISSTMNSYADIQYFLHKTSFKLFNHEDYRGQQQSRNEQPEAEVINEATTS